MENDNGHLQGLPQLVLAWDEKAQAVRMHFNPLEFKTWDFVLGVLEMAKSGAQHKQRIGQMANVQQAAQEAEIRRRLLQ